MRVLVVEDDSELRERLRQVLGAAGYATDTADNGIDGEHLGTVEPYDAIVLDLGLPQRDGLTVLAHWRAAGNAVPVIILTARNAWQEKVEGFKAGADDYLAKPFHMEELLARVGAIIRRHHGRAGGPLNVHGVTLDESRQRAQRGKRTIELTGTEFRLLRYFMLRPGQILSKTELFEHVYEGEAERDSNVIEVYVRRLRDRLGEDLIETRRGQGYIFAPSPR